MATSQINARIDSGLKGAGDAALAELGYTPTKAIRTLWSFAGKNRGNVEKLREAFDMLEGSDRRNVDEAVRERVALAESGPGIYERALGTLGIAGSSSVALSYDDLLEQAYQDKMSERGLA